MSAGTPQAAAGADEPVLFCEPGARWWWVATGPVLGLGGLALESSAPGGAAWPLWLGVAAVVGLYFVLLVRVRRRHLRVELTASRLVHGETVLPMSHVARVLPDDGGTVLGIRVLGDNPTVPRRYGAVVLHLTDGARVVAWARDAEGLRRALTSVLESRA